MPVWLVVPSAAPDDATGTTAAVSGVSSATSSFGPFPLLLLRPFFFAPPVAASSTAKPGTAPATGVAATGAPASSASFESISLNLARIKKAILSILFLIDEMTSNNSLLT